MDPRNDITLPYFEHLARIGKAIASPQRLKLLDVLDQAPRSVERIAECTGMSVATASHHLRQLHAAGLVESDKEGTFVYYRLASEAVSIFLANLRGLGEDRLADIQQLAQRANQAHPNTVEAALLDQPADSADRLLVDLRPAEEYAEAHLPAAVSIPLEQLADRLDELPRDREIVVYCRGPYCFMAHEAVELLRAQGFTVRRFDQTVADWRRDGHPVIHSPSSPRSQS